MPTKYLHIFFALIGLSFIIFGAGFFGSTPDSHNVEIALVAFGGALVGSSLALMSAQSNSKIRKDK